jgi:L-ascorbate metabolism protein UlaG (beta-lactamase superfamily)
LKDQLYYLRNDVEIEPLLNNWYAWLYLISPAAAAMNISNSHLKIMKSYISSPDIHMEAMRNPAMRGGPFIDYRGNRVGEIKALLEKTRKSQAHMLKFAEDVMALSDVLLSEARGYSLEPLYKKVPPTLKGYVELVYDLNNNPSIRFIEGLLYTSHYYDSRAQSIALSSVKGDERAFVFSTPRLEDDEHLHLNLPFSSAEADMLFKMRDTPQTFGRIKEALGFGREHDDLFRSFLTTEKPMSPPRYSGSQIRVRYFGHATVLIETGSICILTDPIISYDYKSDIGRYTYSDLPDEIDYILISHAHADHFSIETLLQLRHKVKNIVVPRNGNGALEDPSLKLVLQKLGFRNVIEVNSMEELSFRDGSIIALPFLGEHADLNVGTKTAYLIRLAKRSLLCAADSSNLEPKLYELIHQITGDIDVLFVGMECDGAPLSWSYGALLTKPMERGMDSSRRLSGSDYARAIDIVSQINCQQVYVYAMGQEPWLGHVTSIKYTSESKPIVESDKLVQDCISRGKRAERLFATKEIYLQ